MDKAIYYYLVYFLKNALSQNTILSYMSEFGKIKHPLNFAIKEIKKFKKKIEGKGDFEK